jgi:Mrp family chromosome partitioning ATPase/uncharacterized protein involved in exopolysaccharide biosynthesis
VSLVTLPAGAAPEGLLRFAARALRRHERLAMLLGALPICAALAFPLIAPRRYQAQAVLAPVAGTDERAAEAVLRAAARHAQSPERELVESAAELAAAEAAAGRVSWRAGTDLRPLVDAVLDAPGGRLVLTASTSAGPGGLSDPRAGAAVAANAFAEAIRRHLDAELRATAGREAGELRARLTDRNRELREQDLRLENQRVLLAEGGEAPPENARAGLEKLEVLRARRQAAAIDRAEVVSRLEALETAVRAARERAPDPAVAETRRALATVDAALARAGQRYTPAHPARRKLENERQALVAVLSGRFSEPGTGADPGPLETRRLVAEADLRGVEARLAAIEEASRETEIRTAGDPSGEEGPSAAVRAYLDALDARRGLEAAAAELEHRLASAQAVAAAPAAGLALVPAEPPERASPPPWGPLLIVGAVLAIVLALAGALLAEGLAGRVRDGEDLVRLIGLPFANSLPRPERGAGLAAPGSAEAAAYAALRDDLAYALPPEHGVLLLTGGTEEPRRGALAANLAAACSADGRQVLLLDADLRQPRAQWPVPGLCPAGAPGLGDYLSGQAEYEAVVLETRCPGLSALTAGCGAADAPRLLGGEAMRALLDALRARFDLTIIDGPAVLAGADCAALATLADAVLLVTRAGRTPIGQAAAAAARLDSAGARLAGAALCR